MKRSARRKRAHFHGAFKDRLRTVCRRGAACRAGVVFLRRAAAQKSQRCAAKQQISHVRRMEHTLHALESIGTDDPIACLAILFHDVGKKAVRTTGEDGYDHFFGHAEKSAAFTDEALRARTATTKRVKTSRSLFCCTIPLFRSARQSSAACSQSLAMSSSTACSP